MPTPLQECTASGQVSAEQIEAHVRAGEFDAEDSCIRADLAANHNKAARANAAAERVALKEQVNHKGEAI